MSIATTLRGITPMMMVGGAMSVAALVALLSRGTAPQPSTPTVAISSVNAPPMILDGSSSSTLPPGHPATGALPPGHPTVADGRGAGMVPTDVPTSDTVLEWTAPPRWQAVPHASTMRIATYRIPRAAGDAEDAELSVTRAGGGTDANAQRWIDQFDASTRGPAKRSEKVVAGLRVVTVEVSGDYSGMSADAQRNWALIGAIVETPGQAHFFKMTGPAKTVLAARAEMAAFVDSFKQR